MVHWYNFLTLSGKERNRSQGLRAIIGLKRDNVDESNHGVFATQTGEIASTLHFCTL